MNLIEITVQRKLGTADIGPPFTARLCSYCELGEAIDILDEFYEKCDCTFRLVQCTRIDKLTLEQVKKAGLELVEHLLEEE